MSSGNNQETFQTVGTISVQFPHSPPHPTFSISDRPAKRPNLSLGLDDIKIPTAIGLKNNQHGVIFQLYLLALALYRANRNGYNDFGLATELGNVGQFDDVVFVFRRNERNFMRFFQAKHSESARSTSIAMKDLKSKSFHNDFSLLKYFESYLKIKKECDNVKSSLYNSEIKDVTIVTNRNLTTKDEELQHFQVDCIDSWKDDDLLYDKYHRNRKAQRYAVKQGALYEELSEIFKEKTKVSQMVIDEFFKKFRLVANYPNRYEIEKMIEAELRNHYQILDGSAKLCILRIEMHEWLAKKDGRYYTKKSAGELFDRIERKVLCYEMFGISKSNLMSIPNEYIFQNDNLLEILKEFLVPDRVCSSEEGNLSVNEVNISKSLSPPPVFISIQFETIGLARIRIIQTFKKLKDDEQLFEKFKSYTHQFGHIFINSSQFLNQDFISELRERLKDEEKWNLIIIELDDTAEHRHYPIISLLIESKRKVILISKNRSESSLPPEAHEIFKIDTNFSDLEQNSQARLFGTEIARFQNKNMHIDSLIGNHDKNIIDATALDSFLNEISVKIGVPFPSKAYIESLYIKRRLHRKVSIQSSIAKNLKRASFTENAFFLSNSGDFSIANDVIVISDSKEDFDNAYENVKSKNFHWLNEVGDKLFWKQSKGCVSELASHREKAAIVADESQQIDEDALIEKSEKIVIISGEYGTGKSTLFGSLSKKIKNTFLCWTIRIDLIDYSAFLTEKSKQQAMHPVSTTDPEISAVNLLVALLRSSETNELASILEDRLLRACLQENENNSYDTNHLKVVLFIDQFSEINHNFRNFVLNMLVGLKSINVYKIFVSTRPTTRSILEIALGSFAYEIEPFSKTDQNEFFEKHSLDKQTLNTFDKKHDFYGTPLYLEIISKIDPDRLKTLDKNCMYDIFKMAYTSQVDTSDMYDPIFQEYFNDDSNSSKRNFDLNQLTSKLSSILTAEKTISEELQKRYADYSVVKFLGDCLLYREPNKIFCNILIEEFLQNREHSFLRTLLDSWWGKYGIYISSDSVEKLRLHLSSISDKLRHEVFGTILNEGCLEIFETFSMACPHIELSTPELTVDSVKTLIALKSNPNALFLKAVESGNLSVCEWLLSSEAVDINFVLDVGRTVADVALQTSNIGIIKLLEAKGVKVRFDNPDQMHEIYQNIAKFSNKENFKWLLQRGLTFETPAKDGSTLLHVAAGCASENFFSWLIGQNDARKLVNVQNYIGHTPLHVAIISHNLPAIKILIENDANVKLTDKMGLTILHYAARYGIEETCLQLLRHYENVNLKTNDGETPLQVAVSENNLAAVKGLIENDASMKSAVDENVNLKTNDDKTPLQVAIGENNLAAVKALIENDPNMKFAVDENGYTILHFAACVGNAKMLQFILKYFDDINSRSNQHKTPLHTAASNNNFEAVKVLIENGADVNLRDGDQFSILYIAVLTENLEMCSFLLKYVNINGRDSDGNTPLLFAALKNKFESLKFLIDNGCDLKAVNNDGWTILHIIAKNGNRGTCSYVLDKYNDIDISKADGATPLHVAIENSNVDTFKVLIENKADVNLLGEDGSTVWHYAAESGNTDICTHLLKYNGMINVKNTHGDTPLLVAALNKNFETLKFLIDKGADLKIAGNDRGWTVLHVIAQNGNRDICSYVLANYRNINVQESFGLTPLHVAVGNSNFEIVKLLIENNADLNIQTIDSTTIWQYAVKDGNSEICCYLLDFITDINVRKAYTEYAFSLAKEGGEIKQMLMDRINKHRFS